MGNIATGNAGEQAAAEYLEGRGYVILARKYRVRPGEIDIVAGRGDMLVFVEVKTRRDNSYGPPAAAVTRDKQRKLAAAAWCYLKEYGKADRPCRFDVIEVWLAGTSARPRINHIENAFGV